MITSILNKTASFQLVRRSFHTTCQLKCGVLSYFYYSSSSNKRVEEDQQSLLNGLHTLKHRGPDGPPSFWINEENTVGLGHTRLAIVDLSDHGRQPLHSYDKQLHLSMNGELYDHDRVRQQAIEKDEYQFTSKSDSEIAMYFYRKYGLEFPKYLRGEFAITMYDEQRKMFIAVRDRFGIKPLYYTYYQNKLLFASEIKALFAFGVPAIWNDEVIYNLGQMRSLQTIYKNIQQLPPGHLLVATDNGTVNISKYYDLTYITREEEKNEKRTEQEMIDGVHEHLLEAVRLRMRADVKVGVYLSGGLDSSVLLGMATTFTDKPIDTYSISFKDHHYFDEQSLCIGTNQYLGEKKTRPHILEVTHNELADHIDDCTYHYEYPLVQLSPVGKFILSSLVNGNKGKVVLTGEGSDEIFSGYSFYRQDYLLNDLQNDPSINAEERQQLLKSLSSNLISGPTDNKNKQYEIDSIQTIGYVPSDDRPPSVASQRNFTRRLQEKYRDFPTNSFYYNQSYLFDYHIKQQMLNYEISRVHSTQYMSIKKILLNILLKVFGDTSEMAHSIEGRTPFLDHYLVDYVNHLPTNVKLKFINGKLLEKFILKEVARPYITDEVYKREKHPFLSPPTFLDRNSKVYQYMQETLNSQEMKDLEYIFDLEQIRKNLNQLHLKQKQTENKLSLRELVMLEGSYLMICSYLTLKKRFNVKYEEQ